MSIDSVFHKILKFRHERLYNEATLDLAKDQNEYTRKQKMDIFHSQISNLIDSLIWPDILLLATLKLRLT
jgi:hypothetical protein